MMLAANDENQNVSLLELDRDLDAGSDVT
nr:MAG: hypothetical protein J07AB56_04110 [Candidatus Nanosalinarum sp. J07AB56]